MRFTSAVTAALFGAAMAAPAPQADFPRVRESVAITEFYARKDLLNGTLNGPVSSVSFKLSPTLNNGTAAVVSCTATAAEGESAIDFKPTAYPCDGEKYSFQVGRPKGQGIFPITLIHQTGHGHGARGRGAVPTYCHAGGGDSLVCGQVANVTIGLHR
ncbi:hypothetical protein VTI28DRAFT_2214 [Corynascus sepedonium]